MDFIKYIEQIPNVTIAKRIASAYVADHRRLSFEEIKENLQKTEEQYISYKNISNRIAEIQLDRIEMFELLRLFCFANTYLIKTILFLKKSRQSKQS